MNPLLNYVGVRSCGTNPESGLFINQFPGMSTELLDKIASQDQITFAGVWNDIQNSSYLRFKTMVQNALVSAGSARMDQTIYKTQNPFVNQWSELTVKNEQPFFSGVAVSVAGSKYVGLKVKSILVYNSCAADVQYVDIRIIQTQDGKILKQLTETIKPGMNRIFLNEVFYSDFDKINIAILVDCSNLKTLDGTFTDYGTYGFGNMSDCCPGQFSNWITAGYSIQPIKAALTYIKGRAWENDTTQTGIYFDGELIASLDAFIAAQKESLLDAWTNFICKQTLWAKLASNRVNFFTQSNREITVSNMTVYEEQFIDALKVWANQLNLKNEGMAFNFEDAAVIQNSGRRP